MAGIGGLGFGMVTTPSLSVSQGEVRESKTSKDQAVDDFLAYMKKSLAERMADAWLAAHGLDRDKLKAMKPDERDAVLKQMAEELKQQLQQAASEKSARKPGTAQGSSGEPG
jgi:acyl-CoA reductase-like NAD-dependent aldehyde dehydrogenase